MATKDIMDPDKFWKNELMKANKDRMFGCSVDYSGNGAFCPFLDLYSHHLTRGMQA